MKHKFATQSIMRMLLDQVCLAFTGAALKPLPVCLDQESEL